MQNLDFKNYFKRISFKHAVLNRPVTVIAGQVGFYLYSEQMKCTQIFTPAGVLPVAESVEEVSQKLDSLKEVN